MSDEKGPAAAFARRVEQERHRRGISKVALAASAKISRSTLERLGTQPSLPLPSTVLSLADVVGIDRDEALGLAGLGGVPVAKPDVAAVLPETLADALARRLPDVDRETLARVVLAMTAVMQDVAAELLARPRSDAENRS